MMKLKNYEVLNILSNSNLINGLTTKKMPIKLIYAIRKNYDVVEKMYNNYIETLRKYLDNNNIEYGANFEINDIKDEETKKVLNEEINNLLQDENEIEIKTVSLSELEKCDEDKYDSLTYEEVNALYWMVEED